MSRIHLTRRIDFGRPETEVDPSTLRDREATFLEVTVDREVNRTRSTRRGLPEEEDMVNPDTEDRQTTHRGLDGCTIHNIAQEATQPLGVGQFLIIEIVMRVGNLDMFKASV